MSPPIESQASTDSAKSEKTQTTNTIWGLLKRLVAKEDQLDRSVLPQKKSKNEEVRRQNTV